MVPQAHLPPGWEVKNIGDILSLEYGKPLPKEKRTPIGLYPVYGANGIKDRTNEFYVEEPSIIVGRKGSAGEINYTEEKFWPLDVTYFTKFDKNELNLDFLFHLLTLLELPKLTKGVKPGINRNDVYAIKTKIPPLNEQKRIVAKLDECFEAIHIARANVKKNLNNAKELFQSQLNQIFSQKGDGWVEKKLGNICERVSVGHVGKTSEYYCGEDGIPFLRSQNVRKSYLDFENIRYITKDFHKSLKKSQLYKGDLLFVRVGANRGDCCAIKEDYIQLNCANIVFARPTSGNVKFLEYYCLSPIGRNRLLGMTTGSAQGVINTKSVEKLKITMPTENEQNSIVSSLEDLNEKTKSLESNYQQELNALDELKKSILQKAFNGEL